MSGTQTTHAAEPEAERAVTVSREIDGPRRLVFEAYTEVRHLSRWWGPDGFTTTTRAFEFRPGGVWDYDMHGPDGTDYPNWIEWVEIDPPARIVARHGSREDDPDAFDSTITLVALDGGERTRITLHSVFKTKAQRDHLVEHYRVIEGGEQTLGRLAAYVRESSGIS